MQVFCLMWGLEELLLGERNKTAVFCDAQADLQSRTYQTFTHPSRHPHWLKKKKKNSFPEIHLLQKLCSLSPKTKTWVHTNTENYSTNSNATQHMWVLQQAWESQHACVGDSHVSAATCINILSALFQDVRKNQSASTRQLLPHFP